MEELRNNLLFAPKNGYARINAEQKEEMNAYCKRYMAFMDACKTEREATAWAIREAEKNGFKPFTPGMDAKPATRSTTTTVTRPSHWLSLALNLWHRAPISAPPMWTAPVWT